MAFSLFRGCYLEKNKDVNSVDVHKTKTPTSIILYLRKSKTNCLNIRNEFTQPLLHFYTSQLNSPDKQHPKKRVKFLSNLLSRYYSNRLYQL